MIESAWATAQAAFAADAGAILAHKDPEYDSLSDLPQERLTYKSD